MRGGLGRPARLELGPRAWPTTPRPMLELRGISKSFGSVQALADVDFEVRAGEVMALVGDNGAGKSTLIKCIAGINSIDSGEIFFDGRPSRSTGRRTPRSSGSRSCTRISRSATTSTSCRTCSSAGRSTTAYPPQGGADGAAGRRDAQVARGDDDQLDPAARRHPLRRPAPVGRRRAGRDVELAGRHPRRADRGARRRADAAGARPRQATRRAGPRRRDHLAQPARRLRGRRPHHRASARTRRRRLPAHGTNPQEIVDAITAGAPTKVAEIE